MSDKEDQCIACGGSGYRSAAENMPADTPSILMPFGTWPCDVCHGKGKTKSLDVEAICKALKDKDNG